MANCLLDLVIFKILHYVVFSLRGGNEIIIHFQLLSRYFWLANFTKLRLPTWLVLQRDRFFNKICWGKFVISLILHELKPFQKCIKNTFNENTSLDCTILSMHFFFQLHNAVDDKKNYIWKWKFLQLRYKSTNYLDDTIFL